MATAFACMASARQKVFALGLGFSRDASCALRHVRPVTRDPSGTCVLYHVRPCYHRSTLLLHSASATIKRLLT
jgi:hypothetical protein